MKKKIFIGLIIALGLFVSLKMVHAVLSEDDTGGSGGNSATYQKPGTSDSSPSSGIFGGKITKTKASQIESLENSGYTCSVLGTTIEINPIKGPNSYIIPTGITSKTGYVVRSGQWIMGKYSGKTTVNCTLKGDPPKTQTVILNKITIFGTSK